MGHVVVVSGLIVSRLKILLAGEVRVLDGVDRVVYLDLHIWAKVATKVTLICIISLWHSKRSKHLALDGFKLSPDQGCLVLRVRGALRVCFLLVSESEWRVNACIITILSIINYPQEGRLTSRSKSSLANDLRLLDT